MAFEFQKDPAWQYLKYPPEKAMEEQTRPYDSKKNVWIPDEEEGYCAAEIKSVKGDMCTVVNSKQIEVTIKKDLCQEMNPPKFDRTEDMSNLSFLNDASVLGNLRGRYVSMLIYTYSGLFCVVINPYKRLPIYTESVVKAYIGKRKNEMPPHLFAAADEAYRNMQQDRECQSMLITGESGAGKTENTKKVLAYFAILGATQRDAIDKASGKAPPPEAAGGKKKATLEDQVVMTNPILESFGNAKTVRNNNSSRFGKFIRVHFDAKGIMAGGDIEHYLLEKSRVVRQAPGERCYHIFYQVMCGQLPGLKEKLKLDLAVKDYWFIAQAELTVDGIDDKEEAKATDEAFDVLGFPSRAKEEIFKLCGAHMHMGNMKFKQRPREEQAECDGTDEMDKACFCYGTSLEDFQKALLKPRVKVGNEWVNKGQNMEQVNWSVGAMGKGLYARLFNYLVKGCNKTLDCNQDMRQFFIGVLDIAGFEIFDFNSFEQLWINFVNEKLQQFFNHHMFVLEQEEYAREGIHWEFIDFGLDLAACIELIEKPMGIISMLDEECVVPKGSDMTYAQKLSDQHLGKHSNFVKPPPPKGKQAEAHFAMRHYAGLVRYNVSNWLEKNKDPLNDSLVQVMKLQKENELLLECWGDYMTQEERAKAEKEGGKEATKKKGKSAAFMTVSMLYRESLNTLMSMLHHTHPHFIRCIIPNEIKKSGYLDPSLVMNQLTCNGVLEGIRICRKGFPNRLLHADFKQRYILLAADAGKSSEDAKVAADKMLQHIVAEGGLTDENFRLGGTKVFFKAGILAHMEDMRDAKMSSIMKGLQSRIRYYVKQIDVVKRREQRAGTLIVQRNIREWLELRQWPWFKLYGQVQPLLKEAKEEAELANLGDKIKELEESSTKEEGLRSDLEAQCKKAEEDLKAMKEQIQREQGGLTEVLERTELLTGLKADLEKEVQEMNAKLAIAEERNNDLAKEKKKVEQDAEALKKQILDIEMSLRKTQTETASREHQIKSLQDEMAQQDEVIAKLNKEKKNQEEITRKLTEDLQAEEDKVNHMNKVKAKLESSLDELEDGLEREKRNRQDIEKMKRKLEGELKVAQETNDELNKQKHDIEGNLRRKEQELNTMNTRLEDEQSLVAKLQKQIKELQAKIEELEEELNTERQARSKAEKGKSDLQRELEELSERLDEVGGSTQAQIELNKKREAELAKLRRDLDEANLNHENQLGALRKKHNDAVAEMGDQLDQLGKQKNKFEKDKSLVQREIEELHNSLDAETKSKANAEKQAKTLEMQLGELQGKVDEQSRQLADFATVRNRLENEHSDISRQLEDCDAQISNLNRLKQQLQQQVEEAKRMADDEARDRQSMAAQLRNCQNEADTLRSQYDEETEAKNEASRQLSKAQGEIQQWRAKFDNEGLQKAEELEDAKRKLNIRLQELQEQVEQANVKIQSLEKARHRLMGELDDAQVDVERANTLASTLEKKQKGFDKVVEDWKHKCDDLHSELDGSQRENRNISTDVFKLKNSNDEIIEQIEAMRRENRNLAQEIKDLSDQLGEGGRSVHELQKMVRRLEVEKEELQTGLDEAESALEAEESKVLRSQLEVQQIRSEIDKRLQEKEEEFDNTRKNHQRALDSMQASLEAEAKGRAELLRLKKNLESTINELEIALDHANKANADAQKNIKRYLEQIKEAQVQLEEEQRARDELREQVNTSEKRCMILTSDKDEIFVRLDNVERIRKQAELESHDIREQLNEAVSQNNNLNAMKRKVESELHALHADLEDSLNELKSQEEQGKKAMIDAARLAEELRQEQDHSLHIEQTRKGLEQNVKEMQARLDEAEAAALKGGKKVIAKLETRVRELEQELEGEQRRHQESQKNMSKAERQIRELSFQLDEDKKNQDRTQDLIDKLQQKLKTFKRQIEETEELASLNLAKFRQVQHQLEDAEERAEVAESSLSKLRTKSRSSASMAPGGERAGGLMTSASMGVMPRGVSRSRTGFD